MKNDEKSKNLARLLNELEEDKNESNEEILEAMQDDVVARARADGRSVNRVFKNYFVWKRILPKYPFH